MPLVYQPHGRGHFCVVGALDFCPIFVWKNKNLGEWEWREDQGKTGKNITKLKMMSTHGQDLNSCTEAKTGKI